MTQIISLGNYLKVPPYGTIYLSPEAVRHLRSLLFTAMSHDDLLGSLREKGIYSIPNPLFHPDNDEETRPPPPHPDEIFSADELSNMLEVKEPGVPVDTTYSLCHFGGGGEPTFDPNKILDF